MGVVEYSENHVLHETVCLALGHLKDKPGKVVRLCLQEVEQMLVALKVEQESIL